eukprot:1185827-Prorocentrum_minimum.AAC.4
MTPSYGLRKTSAGELRDDLTAGSQQAVHERAALQAKLRRDLWRIYGCLPRDMQQTLSFTPHRAALLQVLPPTEKARHVK